MRNELTKQDVNLVILNLERLETDLDTMKLDVEAAYMDANDKGIPADALRRIIKERGLDEKKALMAQKKESEYYALSDYIDHDFNSFDKTPLGAGVNKDALKIIKNGESARIFRGQDGLIRIIEKGPIIDSKDVLREELLDEGEKLVAEGKKRTADDKALKAKYDKRDGVIQWNYDAAGDIIPFPKPDAAPPPDDDPAPDEPLPEAADVEPGESGDVHSEATRKETLTAMGMIEVVPGDELILQPDVDLAKKYRTERLTPASPPPSAIEDEKANKAAKKKARTSKVFTPIEVTNPAPPVKKKAKYNPDDDVDFDKMANKVIDDEKQSVSELQFMVLVNNGWNPTGKVSHECLKEWNMREYMYDNLPSHTDIYSRDPLTRKTYDSLVRSFGIPSKDKAKTPAEKKSKITSAHVKTMASDIIDKNGLERVDPNHKNHDPSQAGASIPAAAPVEVEIEVEVKTQSISLDPRPEGPVDAGGFDEDGFKWDELDESNIKTDQA